MNTNVDSNIKESKNAVGVNSYQDVFKHIGDSESVRIFTDHVDYMGAELNNAERQLFFAILKRMDRKNVIVLDSGLKKEIAETYDISQATISIALRELIEKEIIINPTLGMSEKLGLYNLNYLFIVNPYLAAGGGGSVNLKELKELLKEYYQFNTPEFERYNENFSQHECIETKQGECNTVKKSAFEEIDETMKYIFGSNSSNLEELERKKMELEIKKLELEIKQLQQEG